MKNSLVKTATMVLGLCVMLSGCVWLRSSAIADRAGSGGQTVPSTSPAVRIVRNFGGIIQTWFESSGWASTLG